MPAHRIGSSDGTLAEKGFLGEFHVMSKLRGLGLKAELMPAGHPFDLLIEGRWRVDVKTSFTYDSHKFSLRDHGGQDFYVLLFRKHGSQVLTIPSHLTAGQANMTIAYPGPKSGWRLFDGFGLLLQAVRSGELPGLIQSLLL